MEMPDLQEFDPHNDPRNVLNRWTKWVRDFSSSMLRLHVRNASEHILRRSWIDWYLWPVTAKGTLALSLHVTDLTWIPFRHSSSSQVVMKCYRIVEWDIPWCFLPLSNNSPTPFAPHYYKLQCTSLLWTHYYCKYLCWQSLSHFHCTIHDVAFHTRVIVVLILINSWVMMSVKQPLVAAT